MPTMPTAGLNGGPAINNAVPGAGIAAGDVLVRIMASSASGAIGSSCLPGRLPTWRPSPGAARRPGDQVGPLAALG
jgi:hypothetical protein